MAERQLVIVWHHEPPENMAELLWRVYERLLDTSTLERLTQPATVDRMVEERETEEPQ